MPHVALEPVPGPLDLLVSQHLRFVHHIQFVWAGRRHRLGRDLVLYPQVLFA